MTHAIISLMCCSEQWLFLIHESKWAETEKFSLVRSIFKSGSRVYHRVNFSEILRTIAVKSSSFQWLKVFNELCNELSKY